MTKLMTYLLMLAGLLTVDNYNEYTREWSKGYIKGYHQAIEDVKRFYEEDAHVTTNHG